MVTEYQYKITDEGNQAVIRQLESGKREIVIYNRRYTKADFYKPSLMELKGIFRESIVLSPLISINAYTSGHGIASSLMFGLIPQTLTYIAGRLYEKYGPRGRIKDNIKQRKLPNPYSRIIDRRLDDVVEENARQSANIGEVRVGEYVEKDVLVVTEDFMEKKNDSPPITELPVVGKKEQVIVNQQERKIENAKKEKPISNHRQRNNKPRKRKPFKFVKN